MSTRIEVIIVCTDDEDPSAVIDGLPTDQLITHTVVRGARPCSTPRLVNSAMQSVRIQRGNPWMWVIVHPDVELPPTFFPNLCGGLSALERIDPNYGCIGIMGVRVDNGQRVCVGHLWDRSYEAGQPLEGPCVVDTVDEVCVILRGDVEWELDEDGLATYHLWASDLCMQQKFRRRTNYVLPGLYLIHNSTAPFETPNDPNFFFNLGVLSERYRLSGGALMTPSGYVYDDGTDAGVRLM